MLLTRRSPCIGVNLNAFGLIAWLYSAVAPKKDATWPGSQKKNRYDASRVFLGVAEWRLVVRALFGGSDGVAARLAGFFA